MSRERRALGSQALERAGRFLNWRSGRRVMNHSQPQETGASPQSTSREDVDDLESKCTVLEPEHQCCLPLLSLPGVVLGPGDTLPLRLASRRGVHIARMALSATDQYAGLLVVACWNCLGRIPGFVACTAELRQMKTFEDGSINCLAVGRQRCRICKLKGAPRAEVVILEDDTRLSPPREGLDDRAAVAGWIYKHLDARWLAAKAREAYAEFAPKVQQPAMSPQALSYWLASNVPLHYRTRQELLATDSTAYRLRKLIALLQELGGLGCRKCASLIGHPRDLLAMSEAGSGNVFVNAHGFTHDLVTITKVQGVSLEGRPETEHSWFPGYAWTIARCRNCGLQLGWRFTATQPNLQLHEFWGLRSQAVKQQVGGDFPHSPPGLEDSDDDFV